MDIFIFKISNEEFLIKEFDKEMKYSRDDMNNLILDKYISFIDIINFIFNKYKSFGKCRFIFFDNAENELNIEKNIFLDELKKNKNCLIYLESELSIFDHLVNNCHFSNDEIEFLSNLIQSSTTISKNKFIKTLTKKKSAYSFNFACDLFCLESITTTINLIKNNYLINKNVFFLSIKEITFLENVLLTIIPILNFNEIHPNISNLIPIKNNKIQNTKLIPQKETIPIVLCTDNAFFYFTFLTIESIIHTLRNKNKKIHFVIIESKISREKKEYLTNFIKSNDHYIDIINGDIYIKKKLYSYPRLGMSTFLRIGIFDVLTNFDKLIYLDSDLIVNEDITKLFHIDISNYSIGACRDLGMISKFYYPYSKENLNVEINIKLKNKYNYFNAGVLILNMKKIKKEINIKKINDILSSKIFLWQDQDLLNYLFNEDVYIIDNKWNFMVSKEIKESTTRELRVPFAFFNEYLNASKNPYIVHYSNQTYPIFNIHYNHSKYFWFFYNISNVKNEILYHYINYSNKTRTKENILFSIINSIFSRFTSLFAKDYKIDLSIDFSKRKYNRKTKEFLKYLKYLKKTNSI